MANNRMGRIFVVWATAMMLVGLVIAQDASPEASITPPISLFDDVSGDGSSVEAPTDGVRLLADCSRMFPVGQVNLAGKINMRKRYGVSLKAFDFSVTAVFGENGSAQMVYDFTDGKTPLLAMICKRENGRAPLVLSPVGDGATAPNPNDHILGTDVTWLDTMMDFVYWNNPKLDGVDSVKGRVCDLLLVEPPSTVSGVAKARLWVDRAQKVVLQAEALDANGRVTRRLWVRAVQKVDDMWILKDLEVETPGSGHRTRLHFDSITR